MDHIGAAFASRTMICRIFSVYLPLTELPGVGRKTGKGLYAAGTRTREDIVAATLERLSEVPGIGKARAGKLQAFCRL